MNDRREPEPSRIESTEKTTIISNLKNGCHPSPVVTLWSYSWGETERSSEPNGRTNQHRETQNLARDREWKFLCLSERRQRTSATPKSDCTNGLLRAV